MSGAGNTPPITGLPATTTLGPDAAREALYCQGVLDDVILDYIGEIYFTGIALACAVFVTSLVASLMMKWRRERRLPFVPRPPLVAYQYRSVFQRRDTSRTQAACWSLPHQQKPFFLDAFKVAIEVLLLMMVLRVVDPKISMVMWSVFDQLVFVYVVCLWVAGKRHLDDRRTGALTLRIYSLYCLTLGVPFGFSFKVTSVDDDFPKTEHISPLYFEIVVIPVLLCVYGAKMRQFKRPLVFWTVLSLVHCGSLLFALYSNVVCKEFFCDTLDAKHCHAFFYSLTFAYSPLAIEVFFIGIFLMMYTFKNGESVRYISEVSSLLSWSLVMFTHFYALDTGKTHIELFQLAWVLTSIAATVIGNVYLIIRLNQASRLAMQHLYSGALVANPQGETVTMPTDAELGNARRPKVDIADIKRDGTLRASLARRIKKMEFSTACPICWDEFKVDDTTIMVGVIKSCGHYFHLNCVFTWLEHTSSCPICRGETDLAEDGVRAISYFDLRRVVGVGVGVSVTKLTPSDDSDAEKIKSLPRVVAKAKRHHIRGQVHNNPTFVGDNNDGTLDSRRSTITTLASEAGTPDGSLDREERNRRRCALCKERYEDNPEFMVVGYLPRCGHFFHFRCIWNHVMRHSQCPSCRRRGEPTTVAVPPPTTEETTTIQTSSNEENTSSQTSDHLEIVMALLSNVL